MSRVGKKPIEIPTGVEVTIEGQEVKAKGPKGEISRSIPSAIKVEVKDNQILLSPQKKLKETNALWGLSRALVANLVIGVTEGFKKELEIQGVGYRAQVEGKEIVLNVGFSHSVKIEIPEGIELSVEKNIIKISGINKELVGQLASNIRKAKKPEPYKGKGIRYVGEIVRRKVGKKVATAE